MAARPKTPDMSTSWPTLRRAFSVCRAPRNWLVTTAPPVARAANSVSTTLLIMSTKLTPEMAASPTEDTITPSHIPTSTVSPCSMTRGMMSRISCLFVKSCLPSTGGDLPSIISTIIQYSTQTLPFQSKISPKNWDFSPIPTAHCPRAKSRPRRPVFPVRRGRLVVMRFSAERSIVPAPQGWCKTGKGVRTGGNRQRFRRCEGSRRYPAQRIDHRWAHRSSHWLRIVHTDSCSIPQCNCRHSA